MKAAALEVLGTTFIWPHLKAVEVRRPGIAFDAVFMIKQHLRTCILLADYSDFVDVDDSEEACAALKRENPWLYRGLQWVRWIGDQFNIESYAHDVVVRFMAAYKEYYDDHVQEWLASKTERFNPALALAGVGCRHAGPANAKLLVEIGRDELRAQLAKTLHASPDTVRQQKQLPASDRRSSLLPTDLDAKHVLVRLGGI